MMKRSSLDVMGRKRKERRKRRRRRILRTRGRQWTWTSQTLHSCFGSHSAPEGQKSSSSTTHYINHLLLTSLSIINSTHRHHSQTNNKWSWKCVYVHVCDCMEVCFFMTRCKGSSLATGSVCLLIADLLCNKGLRLNLGWGWHYLVPQWMVDKKRQQLAFVFLKSYETVIIFFPSYLDNISEKFGSEESTVHLFLIL